MSELAAAPTETVDTLTAPTPLLPQTVLRASQSPHSLGLWGRRLGQSDLHLFPLAIGAGSFGRSVDETVAADILDRFVDLGGNFVDASGTHPDARSEHIVGAWVKSRRRRAGVLFSTTVGTRLNPAGASAPLIAQAVEAALNRLGTDHLDLLSLQLDTQTPSEEVLVAVDDLVGAGKVRYLAADAPTADQLIEARVIAAQSGVSPLIAAQGAYSLLHRDSYEPEVARVVTLQGCGFMPRRPLAGGLLAAAEHSKQTVARVKRRGLVTTLPPRRWSQLTNALRDVAADLAVTVPAIALAWLLDRPGVTAPILSVSRPDQLEDSMAAVRIQLTRQHTSELERLSRR